MRSLVPAGLTKVASRVSWTVIDQVLSALSNVLLAVLVARAVDATGFGAFSTAFLIFAVVVGLTRAAVGQPLQITFASAGPRQFRSAVRSALGSSLLIGLGVGVVAVVGGIAVGGAVGECLIALGACLPGLLLQDTCRMAFFSSGRPRLAAAIDALWAVLLFPALAGVLALGITAIWVPIALWGAGATIAALVGLRLLEMLPRLRGAVRWTLNQRRLTGYLLAEFVLGQGVSQIGIISVAVFGSEAGVGALRAAQVLLGPLNIMGAAAFMFAIPEIARRPSMSQRQRALICTGVSGAMGLATALYCGVLLLVPDSLGEKLLGDTWAGAESVLLPMCLFSLGAALATGPAATLYGMGLARVTFWLNVFKAPLLVILMSAGISQWGAVGAAWAMAITEAVMLPFWILRVRSALREPRPAPPTESLTSDGSAPGTDMGRSAAEAAMTIDEARA